MRFSSYALLVLLLATAPRAAEKCPVAPGHPGWLEQQMVKREDYSNRYYPIDLVSKTSHITAV